MSLLIAPSDWTATIRDRTATRKCTRSPANVNTMREKVPKNYKLEKGCDLCDHTAFSRRSRHDLSTLMAFLLRSMGLAKAIIGDPAALSPRSWGSYHASSTCIATARRPHGVSTTFSRRLYKLVRFSEISR